MPQKKRARRLAIGGIKGGIGKTTTAIFLAMCWARAGLSVLVIDADPKSQASRKWWRRARAKKDNEGKPVAPLPFDVKAHPADDLLERIEDEGWDSKYDLIIMDTGGDSDKILASAYAAADMLLLTSSPSPMDVDAIPETHDALVLKGERKIPVAILMVSVKSDAMLKDARVEMRRVGLHVLTNVIRHSTAYQRHYGKLPPSTLEYGAVVHEIQTTPSEATVKENVPA